MWVIYQMRGREITVLKTCFTKTQAKKLVRYYRIRSYIGTLVEYDKFETGNLDAWVTWKHLTKGTHEY
jgi:hypothetical protein